MPPVQPSRSPDVLRARALKWLLVGLAVAVPVAIGYQARFSLLPSRFAYCTIAAGTLAILIAARRSLLDAMVVALPVAATLVMIAGGAHGALLATLVVGPCFLWGWFVGAVRPRGRAVSAASWIAALPLLASDALLVILPGARWYYGVALVVAAAVGAVALEVVRPLGVLADRLSAPFVRALGPIVGRVDPLGVADRLERWVLGTLRRAGAWWATPTRPAVADAPDDVGAPAGPWWRSWWVRYRFPLLAWFAVYYVESKTILLAWARWSHTPGGFYLAPDFLDGTGRIGWGTGDYWNIAEHGYRIKESLEPAFPGLALLMRLLGRGNPENYVPAGVAIVTVAGLLSTLLLWKFMEQRGVDRGARRVGVLIFLLYPFSFLFAGVAYSDPLLMVLLLAAFVAIEADRPLVAGLLGAAATFTRPNSLPLIVALLLIQLHRSGVLTLARRTAAAHSVVGSAVDVARRIRVDLRRLRPRDLGVLLTPVGIVIYSWWMYEHSGDPLYWLNAQAYYGHRSIFQLQTWVKAEFVDAPVTFVSNWAEWMNEGLAALALAATASAVPAIRRRLGVGYATFVVGVFLISWVGPNGFAPAARYLLPVLPLVVVVVAPWLRSRPRILVPLLVAFAGVALLLCSIFVRGGELWAEW